MKKVLLVAGVTVMAASWLVACAPPASPSKVAVRSSGLNGVKYSFKDEAKSCSTGDHVFASLVEACEGLQNDALNKSCAEEARREEFAKLKCEGDFKVVKDDPIAAATPVTADNFESLLEKKDLKDGESIENVRVLHMPRGGETAKLEDSIPLTFHCAASISRAVETDKAPVALGPGSKVIVARYLEPVMDGPKGEETLKPATGKIFLQISCEGTADTESREIPTPSEKIAEKKLQHRQSELEAVLADSDIEGDPTPSVSCKEASKDVATDALNGIYLLDGADVLIYRNTESEWLKAKTGEDDKLSRVVYRCASK